jgi:hypothetical protein
MGGHAGYIDFSFAIEIIEGPGEINKVLQMFLSPTEIGQIWSTWGETVNQVLGDAPKLNRIEFMDQHLAPADAVRFDIQKPMPVRD